jgi:DNA repair exonuclease SbcCD nuclease subunit
MATISIHRALTLISKSNETLAVAIARGTFVSTVQGVLRRPTDSSFKTELELVTRIQSDTDKVESLLNLIAKLKAAVASKNLETKVQFDGREVSITELLAIKATLSQRQQYLNAVRQQSQRANLVAEKQQQENNRTVGSATGADAATVLKQLEQLNAVEVITANKESAAMKIQRLQEQNEFLVNELDYTLSEINLSTYIDIDADIK